MGIEEKLKELKAYEPMIDKSVEVFNSATNINNLKECMGQAELGHWTEEQLLCPLFSALYKKSEEVRDKVKSELGRFADPSELEDLFYYNRELPSKMIGRIKNGSINKLIQKEFVYQTNDLMLKELRNYLGFETIEYKFELGKIDKRYNLAKPCKFLIYRQENTLLMYIIPEANIAHKDIEDRFKLERENILGGGSYKIDNGILEFHDCSGFYGSVPKKIIEKIAPKLVSYLKTNFSEEIAQQKVNMAPFFANNSGVWRELGFSVP